MGSSPSQDPLLYAASAVAEPAEAALSYGQNAVEQAIDVTQSAPAPQGYKPQPQDPRIATLLRDTKEELDKLTPNYNVLVTNKAHADTGGSAANEITVNEYLSVRRELTAHQAAAAAGLGQEESFIVSWSECLRQTGDNRKAVASILVVHYRGMLNDAMGRLQERESTLIKHKQALDRIRKAIAEIKGAKAAIETIVIVYDGIEVVEKTTHAIAHGTVGVLLTQVSVVVAQSTIIKRGVAKIADYMIQLSIVTESLEVGGYTSLEDMQNAIDGVVETIRDEVKRMRTDEEEKFKAEVLSAMPAAGEKRK